MKRTIVLVLLFCLFGHVLAQIDVSGELESSIRFGMSGDKRVTWNENVLSLFFNSKLSDRAGLYADLRFVSTGFPSGGDIGEYISEGLVFSQPWEIEFREAYVDIYGFPFSSVDLRVGKQRIAWGTADKFNPTDNLNPEDLTDMYEFGEYFGSNGISATCYLGISRFQAVYIPVFAPAMLPSGDWLKAFMGSVNDLPDSLLESIVYSMPDNRISRTSSYGVKFSSMLGNFDFSISYYAGREDLPVMSTRWIVTDPASSMGFMQINVGHPRKEVIGLDFAGSIGKLGVWGELAYNDMEKVETHILSPVAGLQKGTAAGGKFTKYVFGCDYTFSNNLYFNLQYLHGFLHELREEDLRDYFIIRVEKDFPTKNFKIIPLSGIFSVADWDDIGNSYGFSVASGLQLRPADALELNVGFFVIDAKQGNFFYNIRDLDELYFKVVYSF